MPRSARWARPPSATTSPSPPAPPLPTPGSMLTAADFDGDGKDDLVSSGSWLRLFRGRTPGLSTAPTVTVEPVARGTTRVLAAADFDGDGRADLAVRTHQGETKDTVAVYPGRRDELVASRPTVTFSTSAFLAP
ncbi:FG-GAP repeat domain-containing protein [Streptomyces sp. DG2A-72]|uniref:FG-GAP repeat domain-containing protein n=1 Tax=Streptomyces sp. DG2A-72 TaxID=3051386 RepID=UPI0034641095